ncbi:MAG: 16S rRNA (adenine(1518)-N(6)/adenine(1519)-N(6))-dimethyltransferase RsmA [Candidatus Dormibacteraeota bacterium]|nr:16S rRNA (adenine(1518)-N(6)/adenine(1519)-N(6))-dimethyltransferase RsmA [Candidatus Dormibacteraeota bacterium]
MDPAFADPAAALVLGGLRAKKSLSQNFLVDSVIARQVVDCLPPEPPRLVEIGAGPGTMTAALAAERELVVAVELDDRMIPLLERRVRGIDAVRVVHGDALVVDIVAQVDGSYAVFGNIPYHITGLLVPRLLALRPRPEWICLLVQLEVAQRLAAPPGHWSLATLAVRASATAELLLQVPARAFDPAPKVDSALVMLRPGAEAPFADQAFFDFARAVFQERRKQLPNAVANAMSHDVEGAREVVRRAALDAMRRPQTLDLDEWGVLYAAYRDGA